MLILGHLHKSVDCGGYRKPECDQCILYRYLDRYLWYLWCNGDCTWNWEEYVCELSKRFKIMFKFFVKDNILSLGFIYKLFIDSYTS